MVTFDLRVLVDKLVEAGIPEKRATLLAKAFNESIKEVNPVSRGYVDKTKEKLRAEAVRNSFLLLFANVLIACLIMAVVHLG